MNQTLLSVNTHKSKLLFCFHISYKKNKVPITDDSTHCLSYHWRGWGHHRAVGRPPPPSPLETHPLSTPPVGWGQSHHSPTSAGHSWVKVSGSRRCYSLWFVCQWTLWLRPPSRSHFCLWSLHSRLRTCHCAQWALFYNLGSYFLWFWSVNGLTTETALTATWVPVFQQKRLSQTCLCFLQELKQIFQHLSIN